MSMKLSDLLRARLAPDDELIAACERLETELTERREEIDNLETELAALKKAEAMESTQADLWANHNKDANSLLIAIHDFAAEHKVPLPVDIAEKIAARLKGAIRK